MKILLVNSIPSLQRAIESSLDTGTDTIINKDINAITDEIKITAGRIAVINWAKADIDVHSLCKNIKKVKRLKYVHIVVILSRENERSIENIIEAGADDFVFKPFSRDEFAARIKLAVQRIKREDSFARSSKALLKSAKEDAVTGLYNRRALLDEALKEMGRASRESKYMSSIIVTIMNYGKIVNAHGTDLAADLLGDFSERIKSSCRPYDKLGRVGISDILLILPDAKMIDADNISGRIMGALNSRPFFVSGEKVPVAISMGTAELNPDDIAKNNHVDDHLINDLLLDGLIRKAEEARKKI